MLRTCPPYLLLFALLAACATTPPVDVASEPLASPRVRAALAELEGARLRGEAATVEVRLIADARHAPKDAVAAFVAAEAGGAPEAIWKSHREAQDRFPLSPWPSLGMARIELQWTALDQAERSIAKAESLAPDEPLVKLGRAALSLAQDRAEVAKPAVAALIAADPRFDEAHALQGEILEALGELPAARAALEKSLALRPAQPKVARRLVALCVQLADPACEAAATAALVTADPKDPRAQLARAASLEAAGDLDGAVKAWEAAGVLDRADLEGLEALARLHGKRKDLPKELDLLRRLARAKPKDVQAQAKLAERLAAGAEEGATRAAWEAVLALEDAHGPAHAWLGRRALGKGEADVAMRHLRKARDAGVQDVAAELGTLAATLQLASPPLDGRKAVGSLASRVLGIAGKVAEARRKQRAVGTGKVVVKVSVDKEGRCTNVSVLEDSVGDAFVAASVVWNLRDASYPATRADYKLEIPVK